MALLFSFYVCITDETIIIIDLQLVISDKIKCTELIIIFNEFLPLSGQQILSATTVTVNTFQIETFALLVNSQGGIKVIGGTNIIIPDPRYFPG